MSVISEAYALRRLCEFLESDAGQKKLATINKDFAGKTITIGAGAMPKERIFEIIHDIFEELQDVIQEIIPSFRLDAMYLQMNRDDTQGRLRANILVHDDALRRESLHYMNKNLSIGHGEGVDDILALFTHGYSLKKRPYGFWVRNGGDSMHRIGARMRRDPNPFLADFVNRLNAEYAGRCVVTLNDKYTKRGGD